MSLFVIVLFKVDWGNFSRLLRGINPLTGLVILPLFFLPMLAKTLRWQYILRVQRLFLDFRSALVYFMASMYWGAITPGRLGELIKVYYLMQRGVSAGRASVSVVTDRVLDMLVLALLAGGGLLYLHLPWSWLMAFGLCLLTMLLLVLNRYRLLALLEKLGKKKLGQRFNAQLADYSKQFSDDLALFRCRHFLWIIAWSLAAWFLYSLAFVVAAEDMGLDVPLQALIIGIYLGTFIGFIPISVAGLGTRDVFFIWYFGAMGVPAETCILFSFVYIYMHLFALGLGFLAKGRVQHAQRARSESP